MQKLNSFWLPFVGLLMLVFCPFQAAQAEAFTGFYTGAGLGLSIINLHSDASSTATANLPLAVPPASFTLNASQKTLFNKYSPIGSLYAGYGFCRDNFRVAAEFFVEAQDPNIANQSILTSATTGALAISQTSGILIRSKTNPVGLGLDFRPGLLINNCSLLYGKIGCAFNRHDLEVVSSFNGVSAITGPLAAIDTFRIRKDTVIFRLGAGYEMLLSDCLALRLDYTFNFFGARRLNRDSTRTVVFAGAPGTLNQQIDMKATRFSQSFMLGLNYYW